MKKSSINNASLQKNLKEQKLQKGNG
jgi:hypothetical protein